MSSEGSTVRIEELMAQSGWLRGLARSLVGDAQADDLAQDALLAALKRPPRADVPLRAWLAGVARKLALARRRGEANRNAREARRATADAQRVGASPAELVGQVESQRLLAEALLQLDEPYRHTVLQRYFEGLTAVEIARRSGVPAGTVRWRLSRALQLLRQGLDERHGGDRSAWSVALGGWIARDPTPASAPLARWVPVLAWSAPVVLVVAIAIALTRAADVAPRLPGPELVARGASLPEAPTPSAAGVERLGVAPGPARSTPLLVTCRAADEDGAPLTDARLARAGAREHARAGADGALALVLDAGTIAPDELIAFELNAAGRLARTLHARWRGETTLALGTQRLVRAAALEVRVLAPDGAPASGAEVLIEAVPGRTELGRPDRSALVQWGYLGSMLPAGAPMARAGADGRLRFEALAPGYVRVWARRADCVATWSEPLVLAGGAPAVAIELSLRAPAHEERLEGLVVDPSGAPLAHAEVRAWRASRPELASERDERAYHARCDERGRFVLVVNPNPGLELRARDAAGRWLDSVPQRVRGGARELRVALREPAPDAAPVPEALPSPPAAETEDPAREPGSSATLAGRVLGASGTGAAGAIVAAIDGGGRLRTTRTDPDGEFRIEGLAAGPHEVRLLERDLSLAEERALSLLPGSPDRALVRVGAGGAVELRAGQTSRVELDADATRVMGELRLDGAPPGPWRVEFARASEPEQVVAHGELDPRGRFELALPEPGRYALRAWLPEPRAPRVLWSDVVAVGASGARWFAAVETEVLAPSSAGELTWSGPGELTVRATVRPADVERGVALRLPVGTTARD